MTPRLLVTSVAGPPEDPRTWSGTPARLIAALRAGGLVETSPFESRLSPTDLPRWRGIDRALGLGHDFIPGPIQRLACGARVREAAASQGCTAVLHLSTYDVPLTGAWPAGYLYVDNTYDIWERGSRRAAALGRWRRRAYRAFERAAIARMRRIFTVGEHVARNFIEHLGVPAARVRAVGTGPGSIRPYHGPKDYRAAKLLTVAKVRPRDKGLPLLLEAFDRLRRSRPQAELTVVGGESFEPARGRPGVRATGWIEAAELQQLFERATLYVMPATYEPWGLAYLEALSCRAPIVGLARHAMPEISGNGAYGFLLERPDADALAALLDQALDDPDRLDRMGRAGQEACLTRYCWDGTARAIAQEIVRDL